MALKPTRKLLVSVLSDSEGLRLWYEKTFGHVVEVEEETPTSPIIDKIYHENTFVSPGGGYAIMITYREWINE